MPGERIQVVVSPELAEQWRNAAEAAGASVSTWVREEVQQRRDSAKLDELLDRVARIEGLLKQSAKAKG